MLIYNNQSENDSNNGSGSKERANQSGEQSHSDSNRVNNASDHTEASKVEKGGKLPNTSSPYPTNMLIGVMIALVGGLLLLFRKLKTTR